MGMGAASPRESDDTTEVLGSAEEAHRRWPAGLAMREASKVKVVPPSKPPPSRENRFPLGGALSDPYDSTRWRPSPPKIPARSAAHSSEKGAAAPHASRTTRRSSLHCFRGALPRLWSRGARSPSGAPARAPAGRFEKNAAEGRWLTRHVGRGAHPTAPEGGRAPRDRPTYRHSCFEYGL